MHWQNSTGCALGKSLKQFRIIRAVKRAFEELFGLHWLISRCNEISKKWQNEKLIFRFTSSRRPMRCNNAIKTRFTDAENNNPEGHVFCVNILFDWPGLCTFVCCLRFIYKWDSIYFLTETPLRMRHLGNMYSQKFAEFKNWHYCYRLCIISKWNSNYHQDLDNTHN